MISSKERKSFVQDRLLHILFLSKKMSGRPCFALFAKSVTHFLLWPPPVWPLADLGFCVPVTLGHFLTRPFSCSVSFEVEHISTHIAFWSSLFDSSTPATIPWRDHFLLCSIIYLLCLFYFFSHWIFCLNNYHHRESEDQILSRIGKLRGFNFWSILFLPRAVVWVVFKLNTFLQILHSDRHLCSCLRSMWQKHWLCVKLGAKFKSCKIGN